MITSIKTIFSPQNTRLMSVLARQLQFSDYGEPVDVVKLCEQELPAPKSGEILVKILAAPINPADINTIQGKYPVKPKFPAVPGNECVAEILEVGPSVSDLKPKDRVIPFVTGLGTWTSHAIYSEKDVMKIPPKVGNIEAATMTVNPCTAYRMLKDFIDLKPGDTVIQNGANSAVGQAVSQLCKVWNINNVGVVRNRPDLKELVDYLKGLGATEILTEEEIRTTQIFREKKYSKPKLGFNCVGGKSALEVSRNLDQAGVLVTYGGMSREPVNVPTASLIFKDLQFRGFWMTRWTKDNYSAKERQLMFDDLFKLTIEGHLKAPVHSMVPFADYKLGLQSALDMKGFTGKKFILDFQ